MSRANAADAGRGSRAPVRSMTGLVWRIVGAWWPHLAALAAAGGVVATTIAGAVGVGDALVDSLRRLALARLGAIDTAVLADDFFSAGLASAMQERLDGGPPGRQAPRIVPAVVMEVTLDRADFGVAAPIRATLLACDDLAALGFDAGPHAPEAESLLVNTPLARALAVAPDGAVVLRITKPGGVPADSPLGRRTAETMSRRLRVAEVLPPEGLGQFALKPAQVTGPLAVVSLETVRALLRRDAPVANVLLAVRPATAHDSPGAGRGMADGIRAALRPALDDLGLAFESVAGRKAWRLTSRRLIVPPEVDRAAAWVLGPLGGKATLAFLANAIRPVQGGRPVAATIPYSTVLGIDSTALAVGDLVDADGSRVPVPQDDEMLIDQWMADDFAAQGRPVSVGDELEIELFVPETLHGRVEETACRLRIAGVVAMQGAAVARELMPTVEGITDEASIADWDPPFPFDQARVRTTPPHDEDDRYWKAHGATPKAFVSLATARRLAGGRFGHSTAWLVAAEAVPEPERVANDMAAVIQPEAVGIRVVPLRAEALAASRGSTPFGGVFLALSSFVVGAGLLLEWLLFSLLVAARRRDVGILAALGWPPRRVAVLLVGTTAVALVGGAVLGCLLGPLWAAGLRSWLAAAWQAGVVAGSAGAFGAAEAPWSTRAVAVAAPAAATAGLRSLTAVAVAAVRVAARPPLAALRGGADLAAVPVAGWIATALAWCGPAASIALAFAATRSGSQAAIGLFFAAGSAALLGLLAILRLLVWPARVGRRGRLDSLAGLAWRGLVQGRQRSFSVAAIVACSEFLIVAVSAFALRPPPDPTDRSSPTGGWTHVATFGAATGIDPADPAARESLGLSDADQAILAGSTIARLRSTAGDDASCMNLYAATQPTVLGLGPSFIERGGFRFVARASAATVTEQANPWRMLERPPAVATTGGGDAVPVILDQATAQWALKLGGLGARFPLPVEGGMVEGEIVGLLEPGLLQGFVLISEEQFTRLFPRQSGYALALVDAGTAPAAGATAAIAAAWRDAGVDVVRAADRLRSLQTVQNTFLSGFQALGTLGLVLGAAGVAAVQLQSVLERRGSFGLLSAVGFSARRLQLVVLLETLLMVGAGLAVGTLAGCLAVVAAFTSGTAAVPVAWIGSTWLLTLAAAVAAGLVAAGRIARLAPARVLAAAAS
jgi:ABC-type antimicrobial peptide transport system permease subunit